MLARRRLLGVGGASSFYPVSIPYSCRFDPARSCYLTRNPSSAGNLKTWTISFWFKPCGFDLYGIVGSGNGSNSNYGFRIYYHLGALVFDSRDGSGNQLAKKLTYTTALLRDPSSWYHILYSVDTTQATTANRIKLYINGVQVTSFDSTDNTDPAQNADLTWNRAQEHRIGECPDWSWLYPLSAYIAEFQFIDGTALTPTSFGQFATGNPNVWVHKTPSGLTYGTNGFHLAFGNASALGTDTSGQGNNFTSSGLTTADQMADTPTNNYCTLNPVSVFSDAASTSVATLSNGNLKSTGLAGTNAARNGTIAVTSGKWYFECTYAAQDDIVGVVDNANLQSIRYKGVGFYLVNGNKFIDGTYSAYGSTASGTRTVGVAFDVDNNTVEFFDNNVSQGVISHTFDGPVTPAIWHAGTATVHNFNFGANGFTYTPPTGFKALCAANMPTTIPAIVTSGSFTGNANADGPFIYTGGVLDTLTINGNAVTWGTHADKLANGFKLRTASTSYNASGTNTWTATASSDMRFPTNNAQKNP